MTPHALSQLETKSLFVDVGGASDSGFRAIAVGFLDNLSSHPRGHGDLINQALNRYFLYFPEHRDAKPGLVTAFERLDSLTQRLSMGELVQTLAYTLRQIAVDSMCSQPERYRGAFQGRFSGMTPGVMRESKTWLHDLSIEALADALAMPIVLYLGRETTLRARLRYHHQEPNRYLPVVLQRVDSHIFPRVRMSGRFALLKNHPVREFHRVTSFTPEPSLLEIQAVISADNTRLKTRFLDIRERLSVMVDLKELNRDDLLKMYVKGLSSLKGCVASLEHGSADFFDALFVDAQHASEVANRQVDIYIQALARAITLEQMDEDDIFSHLEESHVSKQA
ncbi:MAG: hypothetical protein NTW94_08240 [Legionellales bacterium]|nr:hypothetical protein [Legionellales bacterium]